MASLSSGILLKLLQDMDLSSSASDDDASSSSTNELSSQSRRNKPSLLQITSILPAFETSNADELSPDRGFYLRLSDASHSAYAALPKEHDDLILSDQLRIGQLVYVSRFDSAEPVPVLRGLRPLPTRLPLPAETSDLDPPRLPPPVPPQQLPRHTRSASTVVMKCRSNNTSPVNSVVKRRELQRGSSDVISELTKISVACIDEGYDSDSSRFSSTSSSSSYSSSSCVQKEDGEEELGGTGKD